MWWEKRGALGAVEDDKRPNANGGGQKKKGDLDLRYV